MIFLIIVALKAWNFDGDTLNERINDGEVIKAGLGLVDPLKQT